MKHFLVIFSIWVLAITAMAAGEFTGTVNDKPISIVFTPGAFGPGEQGDAVISYDGKQETYCYSMVDKSGISVYRVIGLCDFIGNESMIEAYQPLDVKLKKTAKLVRH